MVVNMGNGGGQIDFLYVPAGAPVFNPAKQYMIVSEWSINQIAAYQLNALGYPIPATRTTFMNATGALGATIDPVSGDWLFSLFTFGPGNKVLRVSYPHNGNNNNNGTSSAGEGTYNGSHGNGNVIEGGYGFGAESRGGLTSFQQPKSLFQQLQGAFPGPKNVDEKKALQQLTLGLQGQAALPALLGPFVSHPGGGTSLAYNLPPGPENLPCPGAEMTVVNVQQRPPIVSTAGEDGSALATGALWAILATVLTGCAIGVKKTVLA
jgi:hypothetical protein